VEQALMLHWCLGMSSSGSTWIYDVTVKIATCVDPERKVQVRYAHKAADVVRFVRQSTAQPGRAHVIKTHEVENEDAVAALSQKADVIVITIRDPRDAVTSLMLYQKRNFDDSIPEVEKSARLCARFATGKRSLLFRYEAGFTDDVTTLDRIAGSFQQTLPTTARSWIFASSRREAVEAFINEKLPQQRTVVVNVATGDLFDQVTHWHTHHLGRTGEIGRWKRMLSAAHATEVERRLGDWMDHFSYQRLTPH
jgi:hypothetical protein